MRFKKDLILKAIVLIGGFIISEVEWQREKNFIREEISEQLSEKIEEES